jgi:hypothetical protein
VLAQPGSTKEGCGKWPGEVMGAIASTEISVPPFGRLKLTPLLLGFGEVSYQCAHGCIRQGGKQLWTDQGLPEGRVVFVYGRDLIYDF